MELETAARRTLLRSPRLLVALAALLVVIVAIDTGGPRMQPAAGVPAWLFERQEMLGSALSTSARLYYDARMGNLADAQQIASPQAIQNLFQSWSLGQAPSKCWSDPSDRTADLEVMCQGVAQGSVLVFWLDHEVGNVNFHVRRVALGSCDLGPSPGAFSCDVAFVPGQ